ncbi:universal stress protein [Tsukamurella serpentis]
MTVIAGLRTGTHAAAPIELAAQLARTTGDPVLATTVVERRAQSDDEYARLATEQAERELRMIADEVSGGSLIEITVTGASSVAEGLMAVAHQRRASCVTVGSSAFGLLGRASMSSVTDRLVSSGALPVAIAPRGYRPGPIGVTRMTAAYGGRAGANGLLAAAAALAASWSVPLRIVSFSVRESVPYPAGADDQMLRAWRERTRTSIREALEETSDHTAERTPVELGIGTDWNTAVESVNWKSGELLLLGAGAATRRQQMMPMTATAQIIKASPAPVMILPRRLTG